MQIIAKTTFDGEHYLHRVLWNIVQRQLDFAKNNKRGSTYDCIVVMTFTFLTVEAYVNFIGERLAPDLWKIERKHFKRTGILGKIAKVVELCGIEILQDNKEPYQTILSLKKFRDLISHIKPKKVTIYEEHPVGVEIDPFRAPFEGFTINIENAEHCAKQTYEFIQTLHNAARNKVQKDHWYGKKALEGPTYTGSGSTTL